MNSKFCTGNPNGKNQLRMGLSIFIMEIFGYNAFMASMPLSLLAKRPIANESEGRNRESWGVGGRPTTMTLCFPYLNLLSYFNF
jgi:hypothetical protein